MMDGKSIWANKPYINKQSYFKLTEKIDNLTILEGFADRGFELGDTFIWPLEGPTFYLKEEGPLKDADEPIYIFSFPDDDLVLGPILNLLTVNTYEAGGMHMKGKSHTYKKGKE